MSKLRIRIEQVEGEKEATVKITLSNDLEIDKKLVTDYIKESFGVDTYSISTTSNNTCISFKTDNEEKLKLLRTNIYKTFRQGSGIGEISHN